MPVPPAATDVRLEEAVLEAEQIAREAAAQRNRQPAGPDPEAQADAQQRLVAGQRNRGRVIDVGVGVVKPAPPRNPIDRGELFLKQKAKTAGQKMRLLSTDNEVEVTPVGPDADVFVTGGLSIKQGRKGIPKAMWDSKAGKFGRRVGTTALQTFLSSIYTMVGWAHEILYHYLYEGWYKFAFKTLFLKEFLGGIINLPKRIINGPERRTNEEIAAQNAVKKSNAGNQKFVEAATRRREQLAAPLRPNVRADFDRTLKRLNAGQYAMTETEPDVPRHAVVPTNAEVDARRLSAAGAGTTPQAYSSYGRSTADAGRNRRRQPSPVDPQWNRRRGQNQGRYAGPGI
jgi:hypothetical protein